jgi:heavy metal translocating P-type ATPase
VFALGIVGVATVTVVARLVLGQAAGRALLSGVAVLVVACPCALGLATPLALAVTLGKTSRAGILVRKPAALEVAARVSRVAFDKTGTLTRGQLRVRMGQANPQAQLSERQLICMAAAVEQYSEHPVAEAIVQACLEDLAEAREFRMKRGQGVSADVAGYSKRIKVGSPQYLAISPPDALVATANAHAEDGETVVWVGWADTVAGFIALRDEPNPRARETLDALAELDVSAALLSGDSPATVNAIAAEVGVANARGGLSPSQKADRIAAWQEESIEVGMVGDGVNDAPALAKADLSLTVASGTDVAGETSDVILTRDDLTLVPWFLRLARRTNRIIKQNLGWAFAYNLVSVPLAAFGLISPVIAAGAMATSSLLVVANSLRLRR